MKITRQTTPTPQKRRRALRAGGMASRLRGNDGYLSVDCYLFNSCLGNKNAGYKHILRGKNQFWRTVGKRTRPASFKGYVYDDKSRPLANVKISIGRTASVSTTDANGLFQLDNIPPGRIDLFVDGRTVNPITAGNLQANDVTKPQYPSLHFEAYAIKGRDNQIAHPIYLPPLSTSPESVKTVGGNEDVILKIPGLAGFQMKVKANSVTFPDGSRVGTLVVSPVTADKLPMAPPAGGAQFGVPAWTVQPAGTRFDPPIEVTLPNASSQPAGDNLPIVQWDHDLGQYVAMGRATVSEDGSVLITDSGSGITKAGWGGLCRYDPDKCGQKAPPVCKDCQKIDTSGDCPTCAADTGKNGAGCEGDECKECKNGACVKKPDKELGTAEQKIDLQVFQRYLDGISDRLKGIAFNPVWGAWFVGGAPEISRPTIKGGLSETILERCCAGKSTRAVKISGTLEFSPGGFSARVRPPTWRIPNPFDLTKDLAGFGALIEMRFSMNGSGGGVKADCDCSYDIFMGGQARLTVVAYADINSTVGAPLPFGGVNQGPRLLDVQGGASISAKAGAKINCNGFTPDSYQIGPLEIVAKLTAGDFIEKSVRIPIDGTTFSGP